MKIYYVIFFGVFEDESREPRSGLLGGRMSNWHHSTLAIFISLHDFVRRPTGRIFCVTVTRYLIYDCDVFRYGF